MRRFDELLREKKLPTKAFGEPENHLENQKGTQSSTIAKVHCAGFMFVFGGVVAIYINIYIYIERLIHWYVSGLELTSFYRISNHLHSFRDILVCHSCKKGLHFTDLTGPFLNGALILRYRCELSVQKWRLAQSRSWVYSMMTFQCKVPNSGSGCWVGLGWRWCGSSYSHVKVSKVDSFIFSPICEEMIQFWRAYSWNGCNFDEHILEMGGTTN